MIKLVIKKVKKEDPEALPTLKPFLNIDREVDCEGIMKGFIK